MDEILKRDQNRITVLGAVTNDVNENIMMLRVDPVTKRLLVSATGGGGGGSPGGSDKYVQFNDGGSFGGESTLQFDKTLEKLSIGGVDTMTVNGSLISSKLSTHSGDGLTSVDIEMHKHSATAGAGASIYGARSRGGVGTETIVQNGDAILNITGVGYDGTDYATLAQIQFEVDGTPGSNDMPGRMVFNTSADGGQTLTERMRIGNGGTITMASLAGSGTRVVQADASGVLSATNALITGSGTNTMITYWTGTNTVSGSAAFSYNDTTKIFQLTNGGSPAKRAILADGLNFDVAIGDISGGGNRTSFGVFDSSQNVQLLGDDGSGGSRVLWDIYTDPADTKMYWGDFGQVNHGFVVSFEEGKSLFKVSDASNDYLIVDGVNDVYTLGNTNNAFMKIDGVIGSNTFKSSYFIIRSVDYIFPSTQGIAGTVLFNTDGAGSLEYQRPFKNFFTQTADANTNNTTGFVSIVGTGEGTLDISADYAVVGSTYEILIDGYYGTTGTPILDTKVTILGGTFNFPQVSMPANISSRGWKMRFTVTVRTDGATGTASAQGELGFNSASGVMAWYPMASTATVTIDTTATNTTGVVVSWGTANASNTITSTNLTFNQIR